MTSAAEAAPQAAAEEADICEKDFTTVELHGHAVLLSAHSQFFNIASSRNNFNKRPGVEQEDDDGSTIVVVSVDSKEDIEVAELMIKTMYGIQLPKGISTPQLLAALRLAHQYRVEPALCSAFTQLRNFLATCSVTEGLATCSVTEGLAVCETSSRPRAYECVLAEARSACAGEEPEGAADAQSLPALAAEVLKALRNLFLLQSVTEYVATHPQSRSLRGVVQTFYQLPAAEVAHLLSCEQLQVVCEDTVLALVMCWLQANQDASTDDRRTVWNTIRLPGLSPWLKAVVLGGLPEATELMDPFSRQHAVACFLSGEAVPPAHLGTTACTYGSNTLAWSPRTYCRKVLWLPQLHPWRPGRVEELVLRDDARDRKVIDRKSSWAYGGVRCLTELQASDAPGNQVDVVVAVGTVVPWYEEWPRSEQAWAPAAGGARLVCSQGRDVAAAAHHDARGQGQQILEPAS